MWGRENQEESQATDSVKITLASMSIPHHLKGALGSAPASVPLDPLRNLRRGERLRRASGARPVSCRC